MEKLLGTGYLLEVDSITDYKTNLTGRGTEANYKPLVCLTGNGLDLTIAEQSTSNKCDGGFASSLPGLASWSFSGDGQAVTFSLAEGTTRANFETIAALAVSKKLFYIRMTDATQTVYREGLVWISSYNETTPNAEAYTFTCTLTGTGVLYLAKPVA